jgi:uncharacterized protein (UPF0332 family)
VTPEQSALLGKAKESLAAARLLGSHGQYGFAAARAYYAMFYLAEALLLDEGLAFSKHAGVISAFGEHFAKTGRVLPEFHRYLIRGLEIRHLADYSTAPVSEDESAEQIARAEDFLALAQSLLQGDAPR